MSKLVKRNIVVSNQEVIPKEITINGHSQKPKKQEIVKIDNEKITFEEEHTVDWYSLEETERTTNIDWSDKNRYYYAFQQGSAGGAGGGGGKSLAVSRLNVIDPHLVLMMRDVMDASETAARLRVGAAAGGGGGGGGIASEGTAEAGYSPVAGPGTNVNNLHNGPNSEYDPSVPTTVSHSINTVGGRSGGAGGAGHYENPVYAGGAGGGGAGGNGGAVVIITTSANVGTINVEGGQSGEGGSKNAQHQQSTTRANDGQSGNDGTSITIRV